MSFACMVVATVSGALAERARLVAHAVYAVVISAWVYPVVVHWVWSTEGTALLNPVTLGLLPLRCGAAS